MTDRERAIDKVRKLLSLSERNPSAEEAAAAALRAAEIMQRHNIAEEDLAEEERTIDFETVFPVSPEASQPVLVTYAAIARVFDCHPVFERSNVSAGFGLAIAGTKVNREAAAAVMHRIAKAIQNESGRLFLPSQKVRRESFALGMLASLIDRLEAQQRHIKAHSERGLVRVSSLDKAAEFVHGHQAFQGKMVIDNAPRDPIAAMIGHLHGEMHELNPIVAPEARA